MEKKVTFIMPIHTFSEDVREYISKAVDSVTAMGVGTEDIMLSIPKDKFGECSKFIEDSKYSDDMHIVVSDGGSDFFTLVNNAVGKCDTEYFSIIEFDDTYRPHWLRSFLSYSEDNDASMYLPITQLRDVDGKFAGFVNEIVWASSFANEYGYIDLECLGYYRDFNVTGAFIRTEDFLDAGGLKPSLGIASWYEFLMRFCHFGKKSYVVPKTGYLHTVGREGSYMQEQAKTMTDGYAAMLIDAASEEYKYKEDRGVRTEKPVEGDDTDGGEA